MEKTKEELYELFNHPMDSVEEHKVLLKIMELENTNKDVICRILINKKVPEWLLSQNNN